MHVLFNFQNRYTCKVQDSSCDVRSGIYSMKRKGLQFALSQIAKGLTFFGVDRNGTEKKCTQNCEPSNIEDAAANLQLKHDNPNDSDGDSDTYEEDYGSDSEIEIDEGEDIPLKRQSSGLMFERGVDGVYYRNVDIKNFHCSSEKLSVSDREDDGVLISYFPHNISQSTLDGRSESQACCVISLLICHWFLRNEVNISLDFESPQEIRAVIVNSIRIGNYLHDQCRDALSPRFLSALEGIKVLAPWFSTAIDDIIILQPKADQLSLFNHLRRLMQLGKRVAALISFKEMTSALLLSSDGRLLFIDTHAHVTHGAIFLRSSLVAFKTVCSFLSTILGADYNSVTLTIVTSDE